MKTQITATVLVLFVLPILLVSGQECQGVGWTRENKTCPTEYREVYHDDDDGNKLRICCLPNSDGEKKWRRKGSSCRATQCIWSMVPSPCMTLDARIMNGKRLRYEEVMREPCTREDDGEAGFVGICCQPNSPEGVLLTTLGAEHNEFPHQARLPVCGGTIYNKRFIITAAHCVVNGGVETDVTDMNIFLGTNIGAMDKMAREYVYKVKRVIPHEEYNLLASNPKNELSFPPGYERFYNDIALVELEKDIQFSDKVKALEIAPANFDPFLYADNAVIVGWGTTETLDEALHLQKANFVLRRDKRCMAFYENMEEFEKQILCVGGIMDGVYSWTAGAGDSGGPAICRKADGHPVLCGITSFHTNDKACQENTDEASCPPSGYAEVSYFRDWIEKHARKQENSTLHRPYLYGRKTSTSEYLHQVHITSSNGKSCGGTLVRPDMVVTAAQCVAHGSNNSRFSDLRVTTKVNIRKTGKWEIYNVVDHRVLPGFEMEETKVKQEKNKPVFYSDNFYKNDLAVIKLGRGNSIEQGKLPKLPSPGDNFDRGQELSLPRNTTRSGNLRSREYKLLKLADCQKRMNRIGGHAKRNITLNRNMLCGVETYSGGSTCDRELGGGLICEGADKKDVLCGVQTFRLCMLSIPNGFVDMRQHGKWVEEQIDEMTSKKGHK